jgi:hypothetical protein
MKIYALILIILMGSAFGLKAQNTSVESARVAFISQKIGLTPVQAEKFWPVYNEFNNQRSDIRKAIKKIYSGLSFIQEPTTEKMKQQISHIASLKHEEANLEKEYLNRYLLVITPKQLADLIVAEREFQKILIRKVSED